MPDDGHPSQMLRTVWRVTVVDGGGEIDPAFGQTTARGGALGRDHDGPVSSPYWASATYFDYSDEFFPCVSIGIRGDRE